MSDNLTQISIRLRIPKSYQQQPIVSQLISLYDITVNITAAILVPKTQYYGWFDLELQGTSCQVEAGLNYLQSLELEIFRLKLKSIFASRIIKHQLDDFTCEPSKLVQGSSPTVNLKLEANLPILTEQIARTDIKVSLPIEYRYSPVLAALVSHYGLTVNINSAILSADVEESTFSRTLPAGDPQALSSVQRLHPGAALTSSSWFDLELWGHQTRISSGVNYLKQLGARIW
ncbi:MAG: NIL domain-containing protein [Chroococcidiopsidaceae cyanobacterium CP_BM_ER_R8_30]|nr:NIL domain-containing protein [Chroococcidiopsidaceae cyanobacterium CP_BM_ER_R8_30]